MTIELPNFNAECLNNLAIAFKKRSKAIKHLNCHLELSKEIDDKFERLNIDSDILGSPPIQIRLSMWSNGQIYFRSCKSAKTGWQFLVEFHGDGVKSSSTQIVSNFEKSINLSKQNELMELWHDVQPYKSE